MNQVYLEIEGFGPPLRRYALALCRNLADADDLVQESIARALKNSHMFEGGSNLRAWLFTIMHNVHISAMRRRKYIESPIDPDIAAAIVSIRPQQELVLEMMSLIKAMKGIPETQREAVILVGVEELSYEQTSERLNVPIGTIKSRVSRGRDALRAAFHS